MNTSLFSLITLVTLLIVSCGGSSSNMEADSEIVELNKPEKAEDVELTVELYSKITNEEYALMMEYYEKFKGKEYAEVKDEFNEYAEKENAIYAKYGIEDKLDMSNFFRENWQKIEEYRENDPDRVEYPELQDAKALMASFYFKKGMGD